MSNGVPLPVGGLGLDYHMPSESATHQRCHDLEQTHTSLSPHQNMKRTRTPVSDVRPELEAMPVLVARLGETQEFGAFVRGVRREARAAVQRELQGGR